MKKISQTVANFLESISIAIAPKIADSRFRSMNRKQLILKLKAYQQELSEVKQSQKDLQNQIIKSIDELQNINDGDLSIRLTVRGCVIGHLADCINSIVNDLSKARAHLPAKHPIVQKYSLQSSIDNSPIN